MMTRQRRKDELLAMCVTGFLPQALFADAKRVIVDDPAPWWRPIERRRQSKALRRLMRWSGLE